MGGPPWSPSIKPHPRSCVKRSPCRKNDSTPGLSPITPQDMKPTLVMLILGATIWSCGSTDRPRGAGGGSGGTEETGGRSGTGGKGTGGSSSTGGSGTGGATSTG